MHLALCAWLAGCVCVCVCVRVRVCGCIQTLDAVVTKVTAIFGVNDVTQLALKMRDSDSTLKQIKALSADATAEAQALQVRSRRGGSRHELQSKLLLRACRCPIHTLLRSIRR